MIRLYITTEGHAERIFTEKVLAPHLGLHSISTYARCVLTRKDNRAAKEYRGGLVNYEKAKTDIKAWLKENSKPECRFTTMFDLYALPHDFPGYNEAKATLTNKSKSLKDA